MGVNRSALRLLLYAKKLGASYGSTLTLGRLKYYADKDLGKYAHLLDNHRSDFSEEYSESLFRYLGAEIIHSLDYSDYEKADIIHDLNTPFPQDLRNKYTMLVDSGTLEHVFNFPVAIKSCMQAIKTGGYFLGITPANNMMGHGFYQFSPELYYRIFSDENGFVVRKLMVTASNEENEKEEMNWYEVPDPKSVRSRIMLNNHLPVYLLVIAEKIKEVDVFEKFPQQSDYSMTWSVHDSIKSNRSADASPGMFFYRKYVPRFLKRIFRILYDTVFTHKIETDDLGPVNPSHFMKVDIEKILLSK